MGEQKNQTRGQGDGGTRGSGEIKSKVSNWMTPESILIFGFKL
jgi:hypothetical protein